MKLKSKETTKVEIQVIQEPTDIIIDCPKCHNSMKYTYDEFCDEFGEPCDWNFNIINCSKCGEKLETLGSDW